MNMKYLISAAFAATLAFGVAGPAHAVTYVFAGSWSVGDGPNWTTNPPVYSGQEAAALLFGGAASDFVISTIDDSVANINFRAHVDGWADTQFLFSGTVAQDYSLDTGGGGYNSNPGFGSAYSAYVQDHSSAGDPSTRNFAFRVLGGGAVPEPATWAFMIAGFGAIGGTMRRQRTTRRVTYA